MTTPPATPAPTAKARPATQHRRPGSRLASALLLAAILVPALAGCLRVQVSMGISSNDRVSGQIVAAVIPTDPEDKGPQLVAPDALAAKIRVTPYDQDGYKGSKVFFKDLTFGEVSQLGQLSEQGQGMFTLELDRSGDLVTLSGRVDLESVPPHGSDVQFSVAFPSRVATTNGTRDGDSTVSWKLPPGEVSTLRAEVTYADPNTRSFAGWAVIVGGVTLAAAAAIAGLAYVNRNQGPSGTPQQSFPLNKWWRSRRGK